MCVALIKNIDFYNTNQKILFLQDFEVHSWARQSRINFVLVLISVDLYP